MRISDLIDVKTLTYHWDAIESIPEFAKLKECEQSVRWHSEGNAWEHTKLVCAEAINICVKERYDEHTHWTALLLASALFHDIGKGETTIFKKEDWHSYGHETVSEKLTRKILWDEGYEMREAICALVRWHMEPPFLFTHKNYLDRIVDISKNIPSWHLLLLLKRCDILGSHPSDMSTREADLLKLDDIASIVTKLGCYYKPSTIPYTDKLPHKVKCNGKKNIDVHVLIGIPGSGKSTLTDELINTFKGPYYIISRDIARVELGLCKDGEKYLGTKEEEDAVTEKCIDTMLTAAALGETIIIDNTNLKRSYRDSYKKVLSDYNVNWIYDYVETSSLDVNIQRREGMVGKESILNMVRGFEWPQADEYDYIRYHKN
jgi:putative nucleotidyltransferase with HDIG domain